MRLLLLSAAAFPLIALGACAESQVEATGPTISRSYPVGDFTALGVAGPYDVIVSTGKAAAVSATGPQELIDDLEVRVEKGTLSIAPKRRQGGNWKWNSGTGVRVTVSVPALTKVGMAGSGDVEVDRIEGASFEGGLAGSGDLRLRNVAVRRLKLGLAGSGDVIAAGRAEEAEIGVAGSGNVDASALTVLRAKAGIAGSGDIKARVTGTADASVMGSGDIEISGGAKCTSNKRGSGEIRCS